MLRSFVDGDESGRRTGPGFGEGTVHHGYESLPPRLLAAVLGIVMMSAAAPLWRWECSRGGHACPDIYQWQRFRDESSFGRYKRIYVKNGISCENMLVFVYTVTLWAFLVCHFLGLVNGGNRIACLIRIDCTDTVTFETSWRTDTT